VNDPTPQQPRGTLARLNHDWSRYEYYRNDHDTQCSEPNFKDLQDIIRTLEALQTVEVYTDRGRWKRTLSRPC